MYVVKYIYIENYKMILENLFLNKNYTYILITGKELR